MIIDNTTLETLLGELIIGLFTAYIAVRLTLYYEERKKFDNELNLLHLGLANYNKPLLELKGTINEIIERVDKKIDQKDYDLLTFPYIATSDFDIILSKLDRFPDVNQWGTIWLLRYWCYQLSRYYEIYDRFFFSPNSDSDPEFNKGKLLILKQIIDCIGEFEKNLKEFKPPKKSPKFIESLED